MRFHRLWLDTAYTVVAPSLLPKLLGSDGVTIGSTIRLRSRASSPYLIAHEYRHTRQYALHGRVGFLWRYLLQPSFRRAMEADATSWGMEHQTEAHFRATAQLLETGR